MLTQLMVTGADGSPSQVSAPLAAAAGSIQAQVPTQVVAAAAKTQTQVEVSAAGLLDRKRFLELAGIVAWAKPELEYVLDRIGWPLREKDWGPYQATVERILRSVDELNAALGTLETEMAPVGELAWTS